MSVYLKRWVSGKKTRFRDDRLGLELDLAYVTDRIIVMGFPAVGVESIYRNHRADVQRFLSARHGTNYWVFNFCPLSENAYHESVFDGRVSRYPFPDHHVPPFLYLSLVSREVHSWLSGSDARVAVLHCKAGKGRSGTLACAYLLSLHASPSASVDTSSVQASLSAWSLIGDKEGLQTPSEGMSTTPITTTDRPFSRASAPSGVDLSRVSSELVANTLEQVLDLHTSRRMKPAPRLSRRHPDLSPSKKPKMGVSIPSQWRWLLYWSQVLHRKGPLSLQPFQLKENPQTSLDKIATIRLTQLTIRIHEPSKIQLHLVQAASAVITGAGKGRAAHELTTTRLWASLSRYSDRLEEELDHWEKDSRNSTGMKESSPFKNDRWDKAKMVRSFARMGISNVQPTQRGRSGESVLTYVLRPVDEVEQDWIKLHQPIPQSDREISHQEASMGAPSYLLVSTHTEADQDLSGIVLDPDRELRIKLFIGEIALGWVWLIPAFHISPNTPSSSLVLSGDDIDFAIGFGKALVDLKISFACCSPTNVDTTLLYLASVLSDVLKRWSCSNKALGVILSPRLAIIVKFKGKDIF